MTSPLSIHLSGECGTAEHTQWEGSSVGLPTNLFPRNEASCTGCKSELLVNVCLPALPHPVCEWTPSFKCSLLSDPRGFTQTLLSFRTTKKGGRGDHSPQKENKPVYIDLLPGVYPRATWAPYPHSILLAPDPAPRRPPVAGGCCSSCMRDSFLISTYLGLRAPTLFLICLCGSNKAPPNFSF